MKLISEILVVIFMTLFFKLDISAQEKSTNDSTLIIIDDSTYFNDTTVHIVVEFMPVLIVDSIEYNIDIIKEFIQENLKYPDNDMDCVGNVIISFIVEKDGTVSNKEFLRRLCPGFDENAMAVVDLMKKWKPGMNRGKPVRSRMTFPVIWKIE